VPDSAPHWHLALNHLPSVGTLVAMCLLLSARYVGSKDLTRASLVMFVVLSFIAIPTFVTGAAAGWDIDGNEGVSRIAITAHQDAALLAFGGLLVTGWLSWFALWRDRRLGTLPPWAVWAALASGLLTLLLMVRTGSLGGEINHPEIRSGADPAAAIGDGLSEAILNWTLDRTWAWPAMEAVHFLGMALLFGSVVLVTLRVLGIGRTVPYSALHRLLPLGVFGFTLNLVTGFVFFVAASDRYTAITYGFYPKIALITVGGMAAIYFTTAERLWELDAGEDAPWTAKGVAVATVLLWSGALVYGRLLPYVEGL
jgi:uncharacterized membrane protein